MSERTHMPSWGCMGATCRAAGLEPALASVGLAVLSSHERLSRWKMSRSHKMVCCAIWVVL